MAKTLEVALWALFLVPALRAVFRHAILVVRVAFLKSRARGGSAPHTPYPTFWTPGGRFRTEKA